MGKELNINMANEIITNVRYIDILDRNTRVGYNFLKRKWYVTTKDSNNKIITTTYRESVEEIEKVVEALGLTEYVSEEQLYAFQTNIETLTKAYYTWQDNGAYIHTIQFNEFEEYPLTLDCEKAKLYVMNSTVIFDLTVDESPSKVRIPYLCSYYKDTLGLTIPARDMKQIYDKLLSYYSPAYSNSPVETLHPTCYNQIEQDEETGKLYYNNIFLLSDYSNTSPALYNCTRNPNNTSNPISIGHILTTDTNTNTITLTSPISEEDMSTYHIRKGSQISISGTEVIIAENSYSADGIYTLEEINNNTIQIQESIPMTYSFPYLSCYAVATQKDIEEMSRAESTITIHGENKSIVSGDTIVVIGAIVPVVSTETGEVLEEINLDGEYTVQTVTKDGSNTVIQVQEEIVTDFTGNGATLLKGIKIGDVSTIETSTISLINLEMKGTDTILSLLRANHDYIYLSNNPALTYQISATTTNTLTATDLDMTYNIEEEYPVLSYENPSEEILINITRVDESVEEVFPIGDFLVDNFQHAQNYIRTLGGLIYPPNTIYNNMYGEVPSEEILLYDNLETTEPTVKLRMTCRGLYSNVYEENKE